MKSKGISRANQNRAIRQEELRVFLENRGKVQYIFDNIEKLEDLSQEIDSLEVQRLKAATDTRLKLVDKYLPSLQSIHNTNETIDKEADQLTDDELQRIATAGSGRATKEKGGTKSIH